MTDKRFSPWAAAGLGLAFALSGAHAAHAQLSFSIGQSIEGARLGTESSTYGAALIPPDTSIAVGTTQVINFVNGRYLTFNKTTGALEQSTTDSAFWASQLQPGDGLSDTREIFDAATGRYFVSAITIPGSGGGNSFVLGVSKTSNILDGFNTYKIAANAGGGNNFADYTQLGINGNGVYLSSNNFDLSTGQYTNTSDVIAVDKTALLAGTLKSKLFLADATVNGFTSHPVTDLSDGTGPEAVLSDSSPTFPQTANYLLSQVNKVGTSFTYTNAGPGINNGTFYNGPSGADQKGTSTLIDSGDTRLSGDVIERNGKIYSIQTVADPTSGKSDLHYAIFDAATKTEITDGLIKDKNLNYYYGSLSVNKFGDIVVGMTGSGAASGTFAGQFASGYAIVGHFDGSTVKFGSAVVIAQGLGKYSTDFGSGRVRWGDWSQTAVDPNNPYSFWTAQEYSIGPSTVFPGNDAWAVRLVDINLIPASVPEASSVVSFGLLLALGGLVVARKRRHSADAA